MLLLKDTLTLTYPNDFDVFEDGSRVVIADLAGVDKVFLYDSSDKTNMVLLDDIAVSGAHDIKLIHSDERYAYYCAWEQSDPALGIFGIIDLTNESTLSISDSIACPRAFYVSPQVVGATKLAFVVTHWYSGMTGDSTGDGLQVYDVTDKTNIVLLDSLIGSGVNYNLREAWRVGYYPSYKLAIVCSLYDTGKVTVIDVSDPSNIIPVTLYSGAEWAWANLFIEGNKIYGCASNSDTIYVCTINANGTLTPLGSYTSSVYLDNCHGIFVESEIIYAVSWFNHGIAILDASNPANIVYLTGDFDVATMENRHAIQKRGNYIWTAGAVPSFTLHEYTPSREFTPILDGEVFHNVVPSNDTWENIRNGAGTGASYVAATFASAQINASTVTNKWGVIKRGIVLFDLSTLPKSATITAVTLSLYGQVKYDEVPWGFNVNVYSSAPAANNALVAGDYDSLGTIPLSDVITYTNWKTTSPYWNNFTLNSDGLALVRTAVEGDGIVKLGTRNANFDVANVAPTWADGKIAALINYASEQGVGYKPRLIVTYTVAYKVSVDWNNDGDFADTYDDITADVTSIHYSRGKSDELGKAEVGQLSITVKNATGKYTPGYGGVISASLLPKRPIKVTYGAPTSYPLFYGFIEEIIPHPHLSEQDCIITAADGLDYLSRHDMATALYKNALTGTIHGYILDDAGWSASMRTLDAGQDTVPYWYGSDVKARFAQEEIDDNEQGFSIVDGAGYFRFEDRYHRSTATHQTSQGTFTNTMANISYSLNPKNVYNIVKVTVTPWTLQAEAELWRLQEKPIIPVGETQTFWGESQNFVDAWVTPVITTDYTASGTVSIVTTKFAKTIRLAVTNTDTVAVTITLLKARGTWYDDQTKVTRKAEDPTSQTAYQKRTLEIDGKYMTNIGLAQDLSSYAIGKYKDPRAELGMLIMNQDAATLTQILSLEISDRITVVNTKLGVNADYFIDYMEHDISMSGLLHTATYRLADCTNEDFWCLDYSKLEIPAQTKLGY